MINGTYTSGINIMTRNYYTPVMRRKKQRKKQNSDG